MKRGPDTYEQAVANPQAWNTKAQRAVQAMEHFRPRPCGYCRGTTTREYCGNACKHAAAARRNRGLPIANPLLTVKACQWCAAAASVQLLYRLPLEGRPIVCNDCRRLWLDGVTPERRAA